MWLDIFPCFQLECLEEHLHLETCFYLGNPVVGMSKSFVLQVAHSVVDI